MIPLLRKFPASHERTTPNCAQIRWCKAERVWTRRKQVRYFRVPDHEDGDAGWYGTGTTRVLRISCRSYEEREIFCTNLGEGENDV